MTEKKKKKEEERRKEEGGRRKKEEEEEDSQETSGITLLRFEVTPYPLQTRESFCPWEIFICQHLLNSLLPFSSRLSRPRHAEIRANFHKIKQTIASPSARLLTVERA